jgi:hypothetical protein
MSIFAEPATVVSRLSFADQGMQTSILCFRQQQTKESLPFPFAANKHTIVIFR